LRTAGRAPLALALLIVGPAIIRAGDVPDSILALDVMDAPQPGVMPASAPHRFVLMADGQVYVGGTSRMASGKLSKDEVSALEGRLAAVRKLPGLGLTISFGEPANPRFRLHVEKGKPLDVVAMGDPARAPAAQQPLGALLKELAAFSHPSLRPFEPAHYALSAVEGVIVGGCRPWQLPGSPADAVAGARPVDASAAVGWPTGATPASVCAGDKRYVVMLRPLVPGEKP
jgi:hypothetical protein